MQRTSTVVVGAGQCGLAASRCLTERGVDHVVLERGEVAQAWRTQRWDSLRLLTPNWMTRLPGFAYAGDDPDGYLGAPEVARFLADYAAWCGAPVLPGTTVTSVRPGGRGYVVRTDRGVWDTESVVVATGGAAVPVVPDLPVPARVHTVTATGYRNPGELPPGGVLVVGASASGVQIADELAASGRSVTLAVGEHVRMPRTYRGRDVLWWMDASGVLDERYDAVPDLVRARALPSMQLAGSPRRATLDLTVVGRRGVEIVGRFAGVRGDTAQFSGSLPNVCALADLKLGRLLDTLDAWARRTGTDAGPPQRFAPTRLPARPALSARVGPGGIETIVWATGLRPALSFLDAGVLDRRGRPVHEGGVTAAPGLYLMGLPLLRRRRSTLIDGAAADARDLVGHLITHLDALASRRAS
ncbi:NAD(P)-binding domain-containing protein [Pseudonocardia sp.]|uniref:NAD(P)-binding domain-containing protein n=1 Tax=Pseudonocardia sp. TaxID=60912 RepID=UPI003D145317